jgi:ribosomal protein S18 acetylase RimI-like enzyme
MLESFLHRVTGLEDAERMREIRNSCRQFMTRNTLEISVDEQKIWFLTLENETRPFLLAVDVEGQPKVGYGLIRMIDGCYWISGGLLPEWRGKGLGKRLFAELARIVNIVEKRTCWLEVRASNMIAQRVYQSLGFEFVSINTEQFVSWTMRRRIR